MGVVLLIAVVAVIFVGFGIMIAGTFCKDGDSQIMVGIMLGIGLMFVVGGVLYAGCVAAMGKI